MNAETNHRIQRTRRRLLIGAAAALVAGAVLAGMAPGSLLPAYRLALFVCFGPGLGSLIFLLMYRSTGGKWGDALEPFLVSSMRFGPWIWLLALPLLLLSRHAAPAWPHYASAGMLAIRWGVYAILLFAGVKAALDPRGPCHRWIGPVGLIVLVFSLHLLADDWLADLDPGWHSTAFPLVWLCGAAVTGIACAILGAVMCGASPRESVLHLGIDWGNLLLAAVLFWCYVAFAQFLIIWAGNLPHEISWYGLRGNGPWALTPAILALIHFFIPLGILLSRDFKRSKLVLAGAAALLVLAQFVYLAWVILPAFPDTGRTGVGAELVLGLAALGFLLERMLRAASLSPKIA